MSDNGYIKLPTRLSLKAMATIIGALIALTGHAAVLEYRFTKVREERIGRIETRLDRETERSAKMYRSVCFMCLDLLEDRGNCPICEDIGVSR